MKHLKVLFTLFLLVMGTCVSWAAIPQRIATWNWRNAKTGNYIIAETNIENAKGTVEAVMDPGTETVLRLDVDARGGEFTFVKSGQIAYSRLTAGCKIRVPVRHAGDKVTVKCPSDSYNYTMRGVAATAAEMSYTASNKDSQNGYMEIVATGEENDYVCFFEINILQIGFTPDVPVIHLNEKGWGSFTCLDPDMVLTLPANATAYVATDVDPSYGDYGKVTLKEVTKFAYGEGVFVLGPSYGEIYTRIVDDGQSDVPSEAEGNITVGCDKDTRIWADSHAYVIATDNETGKCGFYHVNVDHVIVPAGKAYLYAPETNAKFLNVVFENGEEATGIESLFAGAETETPTVFYNLSGQKVGKNYKGVVIGNDGKKYVK